jgi:hypothetical protein
MNVRRIGKILGITSLVMALLPWLGLGGYTFAVPGTGIIVPRLNLINDYIFDSGIVWDIVAFPLHIVSWVWPDHVLFSGEGVATVRPFVVFEFYLLVGVTSLWLSLHRYGGRRRGSEQPSEADVDKPRG